MATFGRCHVGGAVRHVRSYTPFGQLFEMAHHDRDGNPALPTTGCHRTCFAYTDQRRLQQIERLGMQGQPAASTTMRLSSVPWPTGAARMVVERGEQPANAFFDTQNRPLQRVDCRPPETPCYR